MQKRHSDRALYFREQERTTREHVLPFLRRYISIDSNTCVLEIGCGEGGNLVPFVELGCQCTGVDLSQTKISIARELFDRGAWSNEPRWYCGDIYDFGAEDIGSFDLIFMRDVIEHIPEQARLLEHIKPMLAPGGRVFFGFPPWQMPFGGHQQMCRNKLLSLLPYYHLLPMPVYERILRMGGERDEKIAALRRIKTTGISIEDFRSILASAGYKMDVEVLYLINPSYEVKFGLASRRQFRFIAGFPYVRNFVTTCSYTIASLA